MSDRPAGPARQADVTGQPRAEAGPEAGDVLISCLGGSPLLYALRVIPSAYQIVFYTFDDAQEHADRFARWQGVDVWTAVSTNGGRRDRFTPAARYRTARPA